MRRIAIIYLALLCGTAAGQTPYTQTCGQPAFPGPATDGIDAACSADGEGGAEAAQNRAKNSFCATGDPRRVTIADLTALQQKVAAATPAIPFGDKTQPERPAGPAQDRAPLQNFGEGTQAVFQGYVLVARQEEAESVNCGKAVENSVLFHDIHISLVESPAASADECTGIVAEMSPHHRPAAWTHEKVEAVAKAHLPVRVTGQLFFDSSHLPCSGGQEVGKNPRRASLWEIHPIYRFEVCTAGDCETAGTWQPLEAWVQSRKHGNRN